MKMDPVLVSQEPFEIKYIAAKFGIKPWQVRKAMKETQSRRRVYDYIRNNIVEPKTEETT